MLGVCQGFQTDAMLVVGVESAVVVYVDDSAGHETKVGVIAY